MSFFHYIRSMLYFIIISYIPQREAAPLPEEAVPRSPASGMSIKNRHITAPVFCEFLIPLGRAAIPDLCRR